MFSQTRVSGSSMTAGLNCRNRKKGVSNGQKRNEQRRRRPSDDNGKKRKHGNSVNVKERSGGGVKKRCGSRKRNAAGVKPRSDCAPKPNVSSDNLNPNQKKNPPPNHAIKPLLRDPTGRILLSARDRREGVYPLKD